jgi:hypothetical protein
MCDVCLVSYCQHHRADRDGVRWAQTNEWCGDGKYKWQGMECDLWVLAADYWDLQQSSGAWQQRFAELHQTFKTYFGLSRSSAVAD